MGVAVRARRARRRSSDVIVPVRDVRHDLLQRIVDVVAASVMLVVISPVLLLGMLAVWIGSGRPIFFGHERVGRYGTTFRCWKLRTMAVDAERRLDREPELHAGYVRNGYKLPGNGDPRITRVGHILRRTYFDELPQLFNVIQGTMSLVGPRPVVHDELRQFGEHCDELLQARPGLFGAWTSRGRRRPPYPERALLELEYVRRRSLLRDFGILLRCVPVVLRGQTGDM
jgi:exopolysaccharide production protein ExoY